MLLDYCVRPFTMHIILSDISEIYNSRTFKYGNIYYTITQVCKQQFYIQCMTSVTLINVHVTANSVQQKIDHIPMFCIVTDWQMEQVIYQNKSIPLHQHPFCRTTWVSQYQKGRTITGWMSFLMPNQQHQNTEASC